MAPQGAWLRPHAILASNIAGAKRTGINGALNEPFGRAILKSVEEHLGGFTLWIP